MKRFERHRAKFGMTKMLAALALGAALAMGFASCGDSSEDENASGTTSETQSGESATTPVATYTVTFNTDGGSNIASQTIDSGNTATKPAAPTKTGEKNIER